MNQIRVCISENLMITDLLNQQPWLSMREKAVSAAHSITSDKPLFNLKLGWSATYGQLLASDQIEEIDEVALLERTLAAGRVLLSSEAGSGKTWLLARLIDLATSNYAALPVLIQLKDLHISESIPQAEGLGWMSRRLLDTAIPDLEAAFSGLDRIPPIILLVDGLNEVPRSLAEFVIAAVDELARRYPFISVLVADRLVRRAIDLERWKIATVLPLEDSEVRRIWTHAPHNHPLPESLGVLNKPFFLDTALVTDITAPTEAGTIGAYYRQRVGLTADSLDNLANVAFDAYAFYHGRAMPMPWMRERVFEPTLNRLIETDTVRTNRDQVWFTHHLLHDYLAGQALAERQADWGPSAFDVVTLTAASFDSLRLAVGGLDVARADALVRRIYDWNFYGAAYSLVQGHISAEIHTIILAMLADKRWDSIRATVTQVTDALRYDNSEMAHEFLAAKSRSDLFRVVRELNSTEAWFNTWVDFFTIPDGTRADVNLIGDLRGGDSILSWTLANVLRRCSLSSTELEYLSQVASDNSAVVRWRAVHVLGAHPSHQSIEILRSRLEDSDRWVRYGAVRSTVEIASRSSESAIRDAALLVLMELVQLGSPDDSMLRELSRALDVVSPPDGWAYSVAPLIQQLLGRATTAAEQDMWGRVMASIASRNG
jgi:hypothetical protein